MVDKPDDVKAIGHNAGIGEVLVHERAVHGGQIHADDADQVLALEAIQIAFQRCFAATEHHIMDAMTSEITEGGGKTVTARKEVLIDPEHLRAGGIAPFIQTKLEKLEEPAFDRGAGDTLSL